MTLNELLRWVLEDTSGDRTLELLLLIGVTAFGLAHVIRAFRGRP